MRIYCFPLTAVWNAGMSQIFCGAAVGKTRGSPCLGGYKINGPIDGSHAALSLDLRDAPSPPQTHLRGSTGCGDLKWSKPAADSHTAPSTKTPE
jgi:hypothetical protein